MAAKTKKQVVCEPKINEDNESISLKKYAIGFGIVAGYIAGCVTGFIIGERYGNLERSPAWAYEQTIRGDNRKFLIIRTEDREKIPMIRENDLEASKGLFIPLDSYIEKARQANLLLRKHYLMNIKKIWS